MEFRTSDERFSVLQPQTCLFTAFFLHCEFLQSCEEIRGSRVLRGSTIIIASAKLGVVVGVRVAVIGNTNIRAVTKCWTHPE
jgi:hypothetical protein